MAARKLNKKDGVDDLVLMDTVSEESIVDNLHKIQRARYTLILGRSYCHKSFSDDPKSVWTNKNSAIRGRYAYELKPHVYAVAETTYRNMLSAQKNQCVLVSGESGLEKQSCEKAFRVYNCCIWVVEDGPKNLKEQLPINQC